MRECLNHSNEDVQLYISKLGIEETYRQYIMSDYNLPNFEDFLRYQRNPVIRHNELVATLGGLLNLNETQVADLSEIRHLVPANTEGAFWNNVIYLSKNSTNKAAYEEAFHAIIQTYISPQERTDILKIGKYLLQSSLGNKTIGQYLNEQRIKYPELFINQTQDEQLDRVIEEHLANEFVKFTSKPKTYGNNFNTRLEKYLGKNTVGLIQRLIGFFKKLGSLTGLYKDNRQVIDTFFGSIEAGRFRLEKIRTVNQDEFAPFTRLIQMSDGTKMSAAESVQLEQSILSSVLDRIELDEVGLSVDEHIASVMKGYSDWYKSLGDLKSKEKGSIVSPIRYDVDDNFDTIEITNPEYANIVDDIKRLLTDVKAVTDIIEDNEIQENEMARYDEQANQKGYTAQSMWLRSYISTAGKILNQDEVSKNPNAIKIIQSVDAGKVYYSLLRASRNSKSDEERLRVFINFAGLGSNEHNKVFLDAKLRKDVVDVNGKPFNDAEWDNLFSEEGNMNTWNKILHPKSKRLLAKIMKGFDMWVRENVQLSYDVSKSNGVAFNANTRGVDTVQFESWRKSYQLNTLEENPNKISREDMTKSIGELKKLFQYAINTIEEFNSSVNEVKSKLSHLGINVSREYVEYSMWATQKSTAPYMAILGSKYSKFKNNVGSNIIDDVFIGQLSIVNNTPEGIYKDGNGNIIGRIKNIANGNAIFDENALDTTYIDAEGNTIYLHQNKTYNLQFLSSFSDRNAERIFRDLENGSNVVQRIGANGEPVTFNEDVQFYQNNFLLSWLKKDNYRDANNLTHFSVEGIVPKSLDANTSDADKEYARNNSVTFSSMQTRDFDLYRLNVFFNKAFKDDKGQTYAPIYVGNNEAKNTAEFINMPVHADLIDNEGNLSEQGQEILYTELMNEYNRIQRIQKDFGQEITRFEKYNTGNTKSVNITLIDNGNAIQSVSVNLPLNTKGGTLNLTGDYRGMQFTNFTYGLSTLGTTLESIPFTEDPTTGAITIEVNKTLVNNNLMLRALLEYDSNDAEFKTTVKASIKKGIEKILDSQIQDLIDNNIIQGTVNAVTGIPTNSESLLSSKANALYPNNLGISLRKKLLSDFVNTFSLNQLMIGDPALSVKNDFVDFFKRNGGRNAAIVGFRNEFIDPELGITEPFKYIKSFIFKEPKALADNDDIGHSKGDPAKVDLADAQNWTSVDYFRKALWGQTKLTKFHARVLNDIESGKPIAKETMQRLLDSGIVFNSMKTVGFTGKVYHKKSDKMLTREETSIPEFIDEAEYKAAIGSDDIYAGKFGITDKTVLSGNSDYSHYVDSEGTTIYVRWNPKKEKAELHDLRLRLAGFTSGFGGIEYHSQNAVDVAMPLSASKMTSVNVYNGTGFLGVNEYNVSAMDANFYGLQTENPSGKDKIVDPTQMLEIIMSELKGKVGDLNFETLKVEWDTFNTQRDNLTFDIAYKDLLEQVEKGDISNFKEMILRGIVASGGDIQTQQFLNTGVNNNGLPIDYNLNIPLVEGKFIQQFFAYFSKEILSQKVKGDSKVLVSSYGHNMIKKLVRTEVNGKEFITWEPINEQHVEYTDAQTKTLTNLSSFRYDHKITNDRQVTQESNWFIEAKRLLDAGDVYIIDSLRHNVPDIQHGKITGWFSEGLMPTNDLDMESITDQYNKLFGVRIPSQDKQSAMNVKWVDMLPAYFGSSIIVPKEVVYLSGADFDVDKMYMHAPDTYVNQDGDIVPYGSATTLEDKYYEYKKSIKKNKIVDAKFKSIRDASEEYMLARQIYDSTLGHREDLKAKIDTLYKDKLQNANAQINKLYDSLSSDTNKKLLITLKESAKRYRAEKLALEGELIIASTVSSEEVDTVKDKLKSLSTKMRANETRTKNISKSGTWDRIKAAEASKKSIYNDEINPLALELKALKEPLNAIENKLFNETLTSLGLPTSKQDGLEQYTIGALNNKLLDIKQKALNNLETLKEGGISKTPITLSALQDLKSEPEFKNAVKLYGSHWFGAHSNSHRQNTTGKGLIGVSVVAMLGYINALKLSVTIEKKALPLLDNNITNKFQEFTTDHTGKQVRVMDVISTITSANTDEAKEQLNAYFGMTNESQGVVIQMVSLGHSLKSALMFIRQPIIIEYLKELQSLKNSLRLNREKKTKNGTGSDKNAKTALEYAVVDLLKRTMKDFHSGKGTPYTSAEMSRRLTDDTFRLTNDQQLQMLRDFTKLSGINNEVGRFVSLVRLKKGLSPELSAFDTMQANIKEVMTGKKNVINFGERLESPDNAAISKQLLNYAKNDGIIDNVSYLANKMLLQRNEYFSTIKDNILGNLNYKKSDKDKVNKEISSFIFSSLDGTFRDEDALHLLYSGENSLARRIQKLSVEDKNFANNPLIKKLLLTFEKRMANIPVDIIGIDTITKLTGQEQETLIDSFQELYISNRQTTPEYSRIAEDLFTYFKLKDGFQFGRDNLSKIFPATMFSDISQKLNNYIGEGTTKEVVDNDRTDFADVFLTHNKNLELLKPITNIKDAKRVDIGMAKIVRKPDINDDIIVNEEEEETALYVPNYTKAGNIIYRSLPIYEQAYLLIPTIPHGSKDVSAASNKFKIFNQAKAGELIQLVEKSKNYVTANKSAIEKALGVEIDNHLIDALQNDIDEFYIKEMSSVRIPANGKLYEIGQLSEIEKPVAPVFNEVNLADIGRGTANQSEKTKREFTGQMTYKYTANKRDDVTASTTLEAVKLGQRTATTRYESQGSIDYWKEARIGDIIIFTDGNDSVKVEVTKPLHKLEGSGKTAEQWSKLEGWSTGYFTGSVLPKYKEAWQIEYKLIADTHTDSPALVALQQQLQLAEARIETFLSTNEGIIYSYFKNGGRIKPESFDQLIDKNKRTTATNGAYTNKNGLTYDMVARGAYAIAGKEMDDSQAVRNLEDFITKYSDTWSKPYNDLIIEKTRIENEIYTYENPVITPKPDNKTDCQ